MGTLVDLDNLVTLSDISRQFNLTRERCRQLLRDAVRDGLLNRPPMVGKTYVLTQDQAQVLRRYHSENFRKYVKRR